MNAAPLVSVLLCTYNDEKYIAETINSILRQTYTNFEFIIVNDGSSDKTESVIKSFSDSRIKLYNKANTGLIDSLNYGISKCHGIYIARIDGDDVALPNRIMTQVNFMISHPHIDVSGSNVIYVNNKGKKIGRSYLPNLDEDIKMYSFFSSPMIHPSVIIKTEVLTRYNYSYDYFVAEDYELWLRLLNTGYKIYNLKQPQIKYRIHGQNISFTKMGNVRRSFDLIYDNYFSEVFGAELKEIYGDFIFNKLNPKNVNATILIDRISKSEIFKNRIFRRYFYKRWIGLCYSFKDVKALLINPLIVSDKFLYLKVLFMRIFKRI